MNFNRVMNLAVGTTTIVDANGEELHRLIIDKVAVDAVDLDGEIKVELVTKQYRFPLMRVKNAEAATPENKSQWLVQRFAMGDSPSSGDKSIAIEVTVTGTMTSGMIALFGEA